MNQEDKMRKRNIQADIYAVISDGKVWTIKEIAEEVEVHYNTVYRHIHDMAYRLDIRFYTGRINGGIQLILERKVSIEKLTTKDIDVIIITLSTIELKSEGIRHFIYQLKKFKNDNSYVRTR